MTPTLIQVAVMALAIGTISLTITKSGLFGWFRNWIESQSDFLGDLFSCPFCMAHWVALGAMLVYKPLLFSTGNQWSDFAVSWFALVALGSFVAGALFRIFGGVSK